MQQDMELQGNQDVVTKGRFAAISKVTPGRVSQWLKEKKINGAAIVGEGRNAQINVQIAQAQLRRNLDIGQSTSNGIETDLGPDASDPVSNGTGSSGESVESKIKNERLREIQSRNKRNDEEERLRRGIYMHTSDARSQMLKVVDQTLKIFEGGLVELAADIASEFELPQRDVLHKLRLGMRKIRADGSKQAARMAQDLPSEIEATAEAGTD